MRTAVLLLSTVAVALAATCGQTPVAPNLEVQGTKIVGGWLSDKLCRLECGGSVVAPGWVMTAGHCVYDDLNAKNYKVKAGVFDEAKSDEDAEQVVNVKAIHLHPKYNPRLTNYDIALIELATPLTYGDHVQPICLPSNDDTEISYPNMLWATGWGTTSEQGQISRKLRQADVPIVEVHTCEKEYPRRIFEEVEFCAGKKGVDSCQGDSGGPLVQQSNGTWFQYGIVSWGKGCAEEGEAGIYSRVTAYCDFINTTTNGVVQCQ
ncbi:hypothetical protein PFISCL1PPCAC_18547, partial [Pristionchus fissidentatus]